MNDFHLWPEEPITADGSVTVSVTIENPNGSRQQLWYRFPEKYRSLLTTSCDPFIVAMLFKLMHHNKVAQQPAGVIIHGQVSPSLLRNLTEYQTIWACWRPNRYQLVEMAAEVEQEHPKAEAPDRAISTFSGGLDSCFTAWCHSQGFCHPRVRRNLLTSVMIQGFDMIGFDKMPITKAQFQRVEQQSRQMLAGLGIDLIPLETNVRQLGRYWVGSRWGDSFGTILASCLLLFQGAYGAGLIPSAEPYQSLPAIWGYHPMIDPLLSTESFSIIHDGAAFSRLEKIEQLAQWPEALENMLVCWHHFEVGSNCGQCEKCIRTILGFRSVGLGLPGAFEQDVTNRQILGLVLERLKQTQLIELELILKNAQAKDISDSWVRALKTVLLLSPHVNWLKDLLKDRFPQLRNYYRRLT